MEDRWESCIDIRYVVWFYLAFDPKFVYLNILFLEWGQDGIAEEIYRNK